MKRAKADPQVFTVVPGVPWTISGAPSSARTPKEAVEEVRASARKFPVIINVHDGNHVITLEMDKQGRTRHVAEDEKPAEREGLSPSGETTVLPVQDKKNAEEQGSNGNLAEDDSPKNRGKNSIPLVGAVAAVIIVATIVAFGLINSSEEGQAGDLIPTAPQTPEGLNLPTGQDAIAVLGDSVITAQGTTVRILNATTGEQVGDSYEVSNPAQLRFIEGTIASAFEVGSGQVMMLRGGATEVVAGALNARGTEPVVVRETEVFTAAGLTLPVGEKQSVLAATAESVVLFESPSTVVLEKGSVALKAPRPGAEIKQLIRASEGQVVVVWAIEGTRLLVVHDIGSGDPIESQDIGAEEVNVRAGIVRIGSGKYLVGEKIEPICQGGEQVSTTIICPTPEGWESADHSHSFPSRPTVVSHLYSVVEGTVTKKGQE